MEIVSSFLKENAPIVAPLSGSSERTGSRDVSKLIVPIARNYLTNRSSFPLRRNEETILG